MNIWERILSVSFLLAFTALTALYFQQFKTLRSGLNFLEEKDYSSARQEFLKLLGQKPFLFSARLNLALTESLQKNSEDAIGEYQVAAEDSPNKEDRFQAQFNTAFLKFLSGDIPSALEYYQKALKENPKSLEAKVNIEWMLRIQSQENKQKNQKKEGEKKDKQNKKQNSQEKSTMEQIEQDKKKEGKIMNEDQIQFIFKELEERERKLRSKLNNKKGKKNRGRPW